DDSRPQGERRMGERADRPGRTLAQPADIRAEMETTRMALEQKLGELQSRITNFARTSQTRKPTVAKKKAAKKSAKKSAKGAASAKKASGKKSSGSRGAASKKSAGRGKKKATLKSAVGKVAKQATEVMGEVLAGAAVG